MEEEAPFGESSAVSELASCLSGAAVLEIPGRFNSFAEILRNLRTRRSWRVVKDARSVNCEAVKKKRRKKRQEKEKCYQMARERCLCSGSATREELQAIVKKDIRKGLRCVRFLLLYIFNEEIKLFTPSGPRKGAFASESLDETNIFTLAFKNFKSSFVRRKVEMQALKL